MDKYNDSNLLKKEIPECVEVEKVLLGTIIINGSLFTDLEETLPKEAFYLQKHKIIFEGMLRIKNKNLLIDNITLINELKKIDELESVGGNDYISELISEGVVTDSIESYIRILKESYTRRKLIEGGNKITNIAYNQNLDLEESVDECEKTIFDISKNHTEVTYNPISKTLPSLIKTIFSISDSKHRHRGISTGFKNLDDKLSGFQNSDLIILAARPGMGKTTLALDMVRKTAIEKNNSVGVISIEMSETQLLERLLAAESRVLAWKLRTGNLRDKESMDAMTEAADRLKKSPIYIDDRPGATTLNVRSVARRMKKDYDIKLLIVDYLQLITPKESRKIDSLVHQITEVSRTLKQIARELNIPVLALSQLSRDIEKRGGKPRLSDLRDSGSIEQDADVIMFIHQEKGDFIPEGEPINTSILIEKHRNGPTGKVELLFDKKHTTFTEKARKMDEEYSQIQ